MVGGWDFDPVAQTRAMDTSVLGYSLNSSGQGPVALEGLSVRLATQPSAPHVVLTCVLGQYRLTWNSEPGTRYNVEVSTALPNFTVLNPSPITAYTTFTGFNVTPSPTQPTFYRLRVAP